MKAVSATMPASVNSFATSPMRRMFSVRSAGEKPRFLLRPWRTLSPSSTKACTLRSQSAFSSATAMVDFPEPERPVNQTVALRCPLRRSRSARVTAPWCQTMLVAFCSAMRAVLIGRDEDCPDVGSGPGDYHRGGGAYRLGGGDRGRCMSYIAGAAHAALSRRGDDAPARRREPAAGHDDVGARPRHGRAGLRARAPERTERDHRSAGG